MDFDLLSYGLGFVNGAGLIYWITRELWKRKE
jgi:hypothetical protein